MNICEYVRIVNTELGAVAICGYVPKLELDFSEEMVCDFKSEQMVYLPTKLGMKVFYHRCNIMEQMGDEL